MTCPVCHPRTKDITGHVYGRLLAFAHIGRGTGPSRDHLWLCLCDCGETLIVPGARLRSGETKSCGCLHKTHGMSRTSTYSIWDTMIARCHRPTAKDFGRYGARGITVCARWRESFENFLADMGERPGRLTLDRKDNSSGYSPENCRWATLGEQSRNTRATRMVTLDGRTQCLTDWCIELGIANGTVSARIFAGWPVEKALLTPVNPAFRRQCKAHA